MVNTMSAITTHVLDAVLGKPAAGIFVSLEKFRGAPESPGGLWSVLSRGQTDNDGRCRDLSPDTPEGLYRITFHVHDYFTRQGRTSIYFEIPITFHCDGKSHYHLPLLLSDNSYTTYRGS